MPAKVKRNRRSTPAHAANGAANGAALVASSPIPRAEKEKKGTRSSEQPDDAWRELACDPNLVDRIARDIAALGVVGEQANSTLIYAVGTSRKLSHPLRLIIRGLSGAGKSHQLKQVIQLMPPDEVEEATDLSPQALYYGEPGWLKHKLLVMGERSHRTDPEQADKTAAIRQLISEDRIVKQVTIKMQKVKIEQEGPIAFCQTTTATDMFVEDMNRCLQVYADASNEQTKRVLKATAREYTGQPDAGQQAIIDLHRAFQEQLKPVNVVIPFAERLADCMPSDRLESRRAMKQVLATVETFAFLHQFQRDRDADGRLVATMDDYAVARRLLLQPLNESVGVKQNVWDAYEKLRRLFAKKQFTLQEAIDLKIVSSRTTGQRVFKGLETAEVIAVAVKGHGRKGHKYKLTGRELSPVLPESL